MVKSTEHFCITHVIVSIGSINIYLGNDWNAIAYCISFLILCDLQKFDQPVGKLHRQLLYVHIH